MSNTNPIVTVTGQGRVTLKPAVLEHLGVRAGDRLTVDLLPGGRMELRAAGRRPLSEVSGMLKREGERALTIEEMNEVIEAGWAGEP